MRRPRPRRPSAQAVVCFTVVAGACALVFAALHPELILAGTTPSGGDMGAHVWTPAYLRDHLLPHGRLTGWTPDWYAGFPALHFYFPLPSVLIVLVDVLLPYEVAFKLVAVSGVVAMPAAAFAFGRLTRLPFPAAPLLAAATLPFLFDQFHTIWGGNVASTLAGEFSFSIALSLALVFLGVLSRSLETGRHRGLAAVLLAATGLSHLLPAAFATVGAGVVLLVHRPGLRRLRIVATVGVVGFALSAFWLVPFLARMDYSNDMGWERTPQYVKHLLPFLSPCDHRQSTELPRDANGCLPGQQFYQRHHTAGLRVAAPLALIGTIAGLARRRRGAVTLAALAGLAAGAFRLLPEGAIWNARVLPFWYLCLYLLAAVAVAELILLLAVAFAPPDRESSRVVPLVASVAAFAAVALAVSTPLGLVPAWVDETPNKSFVPYWASWNFSGYERKDDYPEYRELIDTMAVVGEEHGCGRAMWEYESDLNRFGTPMALMLLPYWTDGCIGSMEGLYFESSATVAYHFLNQSELSLSPSRAMRDLPYRGLNVEAGVQHLQLLGVRYYMALSPEAQAQAAGVADLVPLTTVAAAPAGSVERSWQVYLVRGSELVQPLAAQPAVVECCVDTKKGWLDAAVDWYQDSGRWGVPLADDGPAEWPRVPAPDAEVPTRPVPRTEVSNIRTSDDRISFDVTRPGTPVLVKTSYFPNWQASGGRGPWRVTPNLMVVVPTGTHVELHYGRTPVDLAGMALTLLGLAAVVVFARRRPAPLPEPPPPPAEHVDPFYVAPPPAVPEPVGAVAPAHPGAGPPDPEAAGN